MCRGCTQKSGSQSFCAAFRPGELSIQASNWAWQHVNTLLTVLTRTLLGPGRLPPVGTTDRGDCHGGGATAASAPPPPPPLPPPPRPSAGSASTVLRRCGGAAMQGGGADTRQLHSRCGAADGGVAHAPGRVRSTSPPPVLHDAVRLIRGGSGRSASPSRLDSAHAHPCRPAARRARGRCAARWSCSGASWRRGSRPPP
jgi:hypothetical protein